jgi:hypothetical protein
MITLPKTSLTWPLFRILVRDNWGGDATSGGGWRAYPMQRRGKKRHGFYLIHYERCCLPMIGRARFGYHFGRFDDAAVGVESSDGTWDAEANAIDLPELTNKEVRIQAAPKPTLRGCSMHQ